MRNSRLTTTANDTMNESNFVVKNISTQDDKGLTTFLPIGNSTYV